MSFLGHRAPVLQRIAPLVKSAGAFIKALAESVQLHEDTKNSFIGHIPVVFFPEGELPDNASVLLGVISVRDSGIATEKAKERMH